MGQVQDDGRRNSLYAEVTARVIEELEQGRLPWVQPWDSAACGCAMPENGATGSLASKAADYLLAFAAAEKEAA